MRIVAANLAIAVVPREVVGTSARTLGLPLIPLTDTWARRRFVICTRPDVPMSATVHLLVSFLQARAAFPAWSQTPDGTRRDLPHALGVALEKTCRC